MSKSLTTLPTTYLPTFRFPGAPKSSSKLVLFQDQLEPPQSSFHLSMEKAPTLAANRFHDDSNKEPETLEDKLMRRLSSFSTVIREAAMTKSLQNLFGATAVHGGMVQEEVE